jgi:hypothetical protein
MIRQRRSYLERTGRGGTAAAERRRGLAGPVHLRPPREIECRCDPEGPFVPVRGTPPGRTAPQRRHHREGAYAR